MTAIWETATALYDEYMESGDPRVTSWFLIESPAPTIIMVGLYIVFVKVIGPAWMMDRKPYDLRIAMFAYNMGLVLVNIWLVQEALRYLFRSGKSPICKIDDPGDPNSLRIAELGWWFYFLKLVEFMDTIFFILRKKFEHISTLHLVHHSIVPVSVWFGFRIEPSSYNYFFPLINTMVHSVMYTYYGLAALGPQVQKYLWWKKYLTTFQIVQFVSVLFYILSLLLVKCKVSKFIVYLNIFLAGLFLVMFYDYFQNTYVKKKISQSNKAKVLNHSSEQKESAPTRKISMTFENPMSEQSLEKKIG